MKDKIEIYSSSFLIPSLYQYDKEISKKTSFYSFNDLNLKGFKKNYISIYVFFLKDFTSLEEEKKNIIISKINKLFSIIELKVKKNLEPFIFTSSSYRYENGFNNLKNILLSNRIKEFLIKKIKKMQKKYKNFYFFDLDNEFSKIGYEKAFDSRNWYFARCHLSNEGLKILYETILKILRKIYLPQKKLLILDCDNTLWGGVVGDLGPNKITLGQDGLGKAFQDFQNVIRMYQKKGLMLALCSKNNEKDVIEVFKKNKNMVLSLKDIVIHKINWSDKSKNIREISQDLNIHTDSFVFWDDNPIERDKVRKNLPDVLVIDTGQDVENWPKKLLNLENLGKYSVTKEDKNKTVQYANRSKFLSDLKNSKDIEIKYLKSIKLNPKFEKILPSNISRAAQICEKTNQFNLRTLRLKEDFFESLKKNDDYICELVNLKDQYGDHGKVGLYVVKKIGKNQAFLVNFIMSCRILGRYLEFFMMQRVLDNLKKKKINYLFAEYLPTEKNQMVENFLQDCKFKQTKNLNIKNLQKSKKLYSIGTLKRVSEYLKIYE